MKATLENFLVKWDGENPLWKEFIEWLNKYAKPHLKGDEITYSYGVINGEKYYGDMRSIKNELTITLEQWKELINKTENMNNVFKKGDRVFVYAYGWCEFRYYNHSKAGIKYKEYDYEVPLALISFTEYRLEGFTQERPFEPEIGKFYWFWDEGMLKNNFVVYAHYSGKDEEGYNTLYASGYQFISDKNPLHDSE